ncbi:MAG: hypothetical protein ACR2MW_08785 [Chthoniobacterales bacterium]
MLSALILVADYLCGPELLFPVLFIFPVMLAAWNCARRDAFGIAIFLSAARFGAEFFRERDLPFVPNFLNSVIRGAVLVVLAVLVSRVARQNAQLARQVKQLEGLIPICAHCKRILDEEKHWTRLETYIVEHSAAEFTHGVCPECARVHYGLTAPNEGAF